ncbi:MAG: SsrA-binding protein SmpB [Bacteroidales bacterium]|jgi:SsrA-binding protein|nr:SsrA-binding protein SmpB [Bacteroidales bacterium]
MKQAHIHIKNKKASHEYEFLQTFECGIVLTGTEIKSIRMGKASINEAYCYLHNGEVWVKGMHISTYSFASYNNHDPLRERKLLLKGKEIAKIQEKLKDKGVTIVPLSVYVTGRGWAKVDIAIARGKKLHDKRDDLKQKDAKREMDKAMKRF